MKEIVYTEPDLNKTAISKSVNMQDDEDYEVMNTYTMLQGDENVYAVPDIAPLQREEEGWEGERMYVMTM